MRVLLVLLLLAAAAAGLTLWRAGQRERAADAAFPPEGQIIDAGGTRIHAVVTGTGPDLVLIHGSSGNWRDFTFSLAPKLAERYRVIVLDRPGLGHSDRLPEGQESIRAQAAALRAAAAALGARRPLVVGQSYGGAVALAWAVDAPESVAALVTLAGPSHPWNTPLPRLYRVNSSRIGAALVVPLLTAWVPDSYVDAQVAGVFAPQAMPEGYDRHIAAGLTLRRESLRANAAQRATLEAEITALVPAYPALTMPIELVHGDADDTVSLDIHARRFVAEVPSARLTVLPGIGHMLHHSAEAEVIAAIDRAAARAGLR